jgi:hypothetical protein
MRRVGPSAADWPRAEFGYTQGREPALGLVVADCPAADTRGVSRVKSLPRYLQSPLSGLKGRFYQPRPKAWSDGDTKQGFLGPEGAVPSAEHLR